MYALHPGAKYFEDIVVGERLTTPGRTVTEADIVNFAGLSGDFHPVHTNEEFAKATPFGGRIAHGLLTLSIASGLIVSRLGMFEGTAQAFLGMNNQKFTGAVKSGDTIHVVIDIVDKRESKKGDKGVVSLKVFTKNQREEVVTEGDWTMLFLKRN